MSQCSEPPRSKLVLAAAGQRQATAQTIAAHRSSSAPRPSPHTRQVPVSLSYLLTCSECVLQLPMQVGNRGPWHAAALLLHSSKPTFPCDTLANLARQLLGHCDTPAATRMAKFCLDPGGTTAQGCSSTSLLRPESGGVTPAAQVWNFLSTLANPQTPDPFRLLLVKGAPVIPRTSSHLRNQKSSTKFIPVCCGAGEQRDGGQFRGRRNRYALSRRHASSCLPSDSIRDVSGMPAERPSPTSAPGATNGYFPRLVNPASCARCAARCWQ